MHKNNMPHSRITGRNTIILSGAALVLTAMVWLSYREWRYHNWINIDLYKTGDTADSAERLLYALIGDETNQCALLLTREHSCLQSCNKTLQRIPAEATRLEGMLVASQASPEEVTRLGGLIGRRMTEFPETMDPGNGNGPKPAPAVRMDRAKETMDETQTVLGQIQRGHSLARNQIPRKGKAAAALGLPVSVTGSPILLFLLAFGVGPFLHIDLRPARSWPVRYGIGIVAVGAAILLRIALTPLIETTALALITFLPAVLISTSFGGFRAGILCLALSALVSDYLFTQPVKSLEIDNRGELITLLVFVIVGFGMALLSHSERRAVERAIRAENAERHERLRFETTLASIGDAVIATDAEGKVAFANPVALSLVGCSETEIKGMHLDEAFRIVNEYTRVPVESPVTKVLREGAIVGMSNHTVLLSRNGAEVPIDDSAAPIRDGSGTVQGTVLVFRDITARRVAERSRQLLSSIVESSEDAIISRDLNGVITSWNKGAEYMFGYRAEEVIGQTDAILAAPGRAYETLEILDRIRRGEHINHYQTTRLSKSGQVVHASVSVSPVNDEAGRIIGASKIVRDITAQVRAQEEIAEQRERLRVTLNSIGDGVMTTDVTGRVSYLNSVAEQLTGLTTGEASGKPVDDVFRIINEDSGRPVESPVATVLREGQVVGLANHTVLLSRAGGQVFIDDSAAPIRNVHGEMIGVVLIFRDITERRSAEKLLAAQAAELRQRAHLMERAQVCVLDTDHRIVYWNQGAAELYGFSAAEAVGSISHSLLRTRFPKPFEEIQAQLMETGMWDGQLVQTRRDGAQVVVATHWALYRDSEQRAVSILEVNVDVTERSRIEQALRASEDRLATIMKHLPVGVGVIDATGRVVIGNRLWRQFLHGERPSVDDSESTKWRANGSHSRSLACLEDSAARALRGADVLPGIDFLRKTAGGADRWTRVSAVPLRDAAGGIIGALTLLQDIEEERRAEEQRLELAAKERALASERALRETEAELARVVRALSVGELATSIAHEVNQPLAGVVTNAEAGLRWLSGPTPEIEEAKESLALIVRDGNRAGMVIRRIREFLKKGGPQSASLQINEVAYEAVALARSELLKREVTIRLRMSGELPPIWGDRIQLQQVLLNLIMNGAEAMISVTGVKELRVATQHCSDGGVLVSVRDSGVGMRPEEMPFMFNAFFTTKPDGMGMGLSISRSIIEAHGGRIWAQPNDGPGLTVQFGLPAEATLPASALASGAR
jgi:PAS domain S-box-containing protein